MTPQDEHSELQKSPDLHHESSEINMSEVTKTMQESDGALETEHPVCNTSDPGQMKEDSKYFYLYIFH